MWFHGSLNPNGASLTRHAQWPWRHFSSVRLATPLLLAIGSGWSRWVVVWTDSGGIGSYEIRVHQPGCTHKRNTLNFPPTPHPIEGDSSWHAPPLKMYIWLLFCAFPWEPEAKVIRWELSVLVVSAFDVFVLAGIAEGRLQPSGQLWSMQTETTPEILSFLLSLGNRGEAKGPEVLRRKNGQWALLYTAIPLRSSAVRQGMASGPYYIQLYL